MKTKKGTRTTVAFAGEFIVKQLIESFSKKESHYGTGAHLFEVCVKLTTGVEYSEIVVCVCQEKNKTEREYFRTSALKARYDEEFGVENQKVSESVENFFARHEILEADFAKMLKRNLAIRKQIMAKVQKRLSEVIADYES